MVMATGFLGWVAAFAYEVRVRDRLLAAEESGGCSNVHQLRCRVTRPNWFSSSKYQIACKGMLWSGVAGIAGHLATT